VYSLYYKTKTSHFSPLNYNIMGKGVTRQKAFIVKISICGKQYTVGHYDDEQEAQTAYDAFSGIRDEIHNEGHRRVKEFIESRKSVCITDDCTV